LKEVNYPENRKKYNGNELQAREFSDESGLELYDFNARTYDAQIGRFLQIDPLAEDNQRDFTPYHFAFNNPVKYGDPDGKFPIFLIPIVIEAIEVAIVSYRAYATVNSAINLLSEAAGKDGAKPKGKEAIPAAKDETAVPLPAPGKAIDEKSKPKVSPEVADELEKMESITIPDTKPKPQQKPAEDLSRTAQDVISKDRQGGVSKVFPGQYLHKTLAEIQKDANAGNQAARKALKLLKDGRFKKNQ
jgi:RHS repeat-associated protein